MSLLPIAVSIGEPAGIGPDIVISAFAAGLLEPHIPLIILGDPDILEKRAAALNFQISIQTVDTIEPAIPASRTVFVLSTGPMVAAPGRPNGGDSDAVVRAIEMGVDLVMQGKASALVTCPINKDVLYQSGFTHPGHTEYLAHLCAQKTQQTYHPVMMLCGPELKTVPVTIHIPLSQVHNRLSAELIIETGRIVAADLVRRFAVSSPRLAVSGLNPHAGENGSMGHEEKDIIEPAVRALKAEGIDAIGPLPADTMFHAAARNRYDAALCMYHDQALIPAKTLAFEDGVNTTLGLPLIRTSPDHGTAFDIAGTGKANPASFVAAVHLAATMASNAGTDRSGR